MERGSAIYLAFTSNEQYGDPPNSVYYGWVQLGIDTDGNLVALNSACDFDHGPMVVGGGAWEGGIPEPSGGMLLLIGAAVLGLRRVKKLGEERRGWSAPLGGAGVVEQHNEP